MKPRALVNEVELGVRLNSCLVDGVHANAGRARLLQRLLEHQAVHVGRSNELGTAGVERLVRHRNCPNFVNRARELGMHKIDWLRGYRRVVTQIRILIPVRLHLVRRLSPRGHLVARSQLRSQPNVCLLALWRQNSGCFRLEEHRKTNESLGHASGSSFGICWKQVQTFIGSNRVCLRVLLRGCHHSLYQT